MRFAIVLGAALLLVTSGVAQAADEVVVKDQKVVKKAACEKAVSETGGHCRETVSPPRTPYYAIPEHQLHPADSPEAAPAQQTQSEVSEELEPLPEWDWPRKHLEQGRHFIDSYVAAELYPEISVSTTLLADQVAGPRTIEFLSLVNLSLYFLELRFPLVSQIDGEPLSDQRVDLDLKIPFAWPGSETVRFAVNYGALIASDGPALANSSRFELLGGYGGPVAIQGRIGYGYRELSFSSEPELGLLYGAILGFDAGVVEPSIELDGVRTTGTRSDRIALIPSLRFFPVGDQTLEFGLGALIILGNGELNPNDRFGAVFELGYNFL